MNEGKWRPRKSRSSNKGGKEYVIQNNISGRNETYRTWCTSEHLVPWIYNVECFYPRVSKGEGYSELLKWKQILGERKKE